MIFKSRNHSGIDRNEYLRVLDKIIGEKHMVDLYDPDVSLLITINKDLLCFGICLNYRLQKKYNLQKSSNLEGRKTKEPNEELPSVILPIKTPLSEDIQIIEKVKENEEEISGEEELDVVKLI